MRTLLLSGLALASAGAAWAETPGEAFAGLIGSCWRAELSGGASDTHCFTAAVGGDLVIDIHAVRNGSGVTVYEGVTVYRVETGAEAIRYDYYNSQGDLLTGYARRQADRLVFSPEPVGAPDVVWYLGPDAYEAGSAAVTAARTRFAKAGPAHGEGL